GFLRLLARAQLDAADLAAHGLRQTVDEFDLPGVLVGRGHAFHVLLELAHERVAREMAGPQDDEGLHELAAHRVGTRHDRRFDHRRVLEQRALHLERADAIPRRDDDVVSAADEPELAADIAPAAGPSHVPLATHTA